tara:strand:- start:165 stop:2759 length:2595 start_codon:yes stop_codon:yes gene_type:complete
MSTVYKKLTAQDIAVVPFNAHKQYNFDSASAASNSLTYYDTRWTSESIDIYSSGSSSIDNRDKINTIKYSQIDHLFYRNYKLDLSNRFGVSDLHYINHKRSLHQTANILSIPAGLYGHQIYPGSFILSGSSGGALLGNKENLIVDDSSGNLIISGTNLDNYITDPRENLLNIGPVNGFKKYDLNTYQGYVKLNSHQRTTFWRDGKEVVNKYTSYNTPDLGDEFDDSYYFNLMKYKNANFSERRLFNGYFAGIDFNSSSLELGHNEKFNFNPGDDFSITFWANISHSADYTSHLISKSTTKTVVPSPSTGQTGLVVTTSTTGSSQTIDVPAEPSYPFEVYVKNGPNTSPHVFFERSDGLVTTTVSASIITSSLGIAIASSSLGAYGQLYGNPYNQMQHVACVVSSSNMAIFINGVWSGISGSDNTVSQTQNTANLYIGNKGGKTNYFSGSLSQINIYNKGLSNTQVLNHYSSSNGSPYVGNIFYSSGMIVITHPEHQDILGNGENNIENLVYKGDEFSVNSQEPNAYQITFSPDGTRMYLIGDKDIIYQYSLSTPWEISTMAYVGASPDLTAVDNNMQSLAISADGMQVYTGGNENNKIYQFTLTTAWDITTCPSSATKEFALPSVGAGSGDSQPTSISFSPNGKYIFILVSGGFIRRFVLSVAWDITTATEDRSASFREYTTTPWGMQFSNDGKKMFLYQLLSDWMVEIDLSIPWDIQTGTAYYKRRWNDTGNLGQAQSIYINPSGSRLYAYDTTGNDVTQYNFTPNIINQIQFQGSHLIYENEYQCTVDEYEYNETTNISARKIRSNDSEDMANFATSSLFKPYVTTIGLYNEDQELLVVGKLGSPIRCSDETDTTFILRWDT